MGKLENRINRGETVNPCELSVTITAIANLLANILTEEELGIAAVSFTQLGDTLATILAQRAICNNIKEEKKGRE